MRANAFCIRGLSKARLLKIPAVQRKFVAAKCGDQHAASVRSPEIGTGRSVRDYRLVRPRLIPGRIEINGALEMLVRKFDHSEMF